MDFHSIVQAGWDAWGQLPRARCASYSPGYLRLERLYDVGTALAYFAFGLRFLVVARRLDLLPSPILRTLTGLFIVFCGSNHLIRALTGYSIGLMPVGNAVGLVMALISWGAVFALEGLARKSRVIPDSAIVGAETYARAYFVLLAVALALGGVGTWGYRSLAGFIEQSASRRREFAASRDLERLVSMVRGAESGQRGYLLTLDTAYLAPYGRAIAAVPSLLQAVTESPAWPPEEVAALGDDVRAKLVEMGHTVDLARDGHKMDALSVVGSDHGRQLMVRIHDRSARLVTGLDAASTAREVPLERSASAALVAIPVVGMLAPVMAFGSIAYGLREARARAKSDALAASAAEESRRNVELLNALSHDVRMPLNAIVQSADLAATLARFHSPDFDRLVACMADIKAGVRSMAEMTEGFLETSRAEHGRPEPSTFLLCPHLRDVIAMFAADAHAKGLALTVACSADLEARTDHRLLRRIATNLVGNAVKFTNRGNVAVSASRDDGRGVVIEVRDTGPGIAADDIPKLFRDFAQLGGVNPERQPTKGFGLGLATAKRLCRQLGGTIGVESEPGRGSTFVVRLPDLDVDLLPAVAQ